MSQSNENAAPLSPDDPRLTAYALGEMREGGMDPAEIKAFEALLAGDEAAQAEVESIRALAGDLESELAEVPEAEGLGSARRAAVLAIRQPSEDAAETSARERRWRPVKWTALALAACLLIGVPILIVAIGGGAGSGRPEESAELARSGAKPTDLPALVDGRGVGSEAGQPASPESEPMGQASAETDNDAGSLPGEIKESADSEEGSEMPAPVPEPLPGGSSFRLPLPPTGPPMTPPATPPMVPSPDPRVVPVWMGAKPNGAAPRPVAPSHPIFGAAGRSRGGSRGSTGGASMTSLAGGPVPTTPPPGGTYGYLPGTESLSLSGDKVAAGGYAKVQSYWRGWQADGRWAGWSTQTHGETYVHPGIDGFMQVTKRSGHTSTFSVDVDSASYTNVRRLLNHGQRPHPAAVRIEEFVNYFDYAYPAPDADSKEPFAQHIQVATCPWNPKHRLARIALKGKEIALAARPASNLVFLVDVSGSMRSEDKLPLLQSGLEMLTENLDARDRVSIVTYSSAASLTLESTNGDQREQILARIRALRAGGSTNGAGGIQLAYAEAQKHFLKDGINRVILCTDGDFNVGVSDGPGLTQLVQTKAKGGVYLSVLGFGTGNLQDGKMEAYSNAGNGNYAYIDGLAEARRVLVEQMEGTLITIAKDVKFQVWFNPKKVHAWRLLGYENRRLAAKDFNNDSKDAGDIGAGHEVTALYEIVPNGVGLPAAVDPNPFVSGAKKPLKEEAPVGANDGPRPAEDALFIWRLRWKQPNGTQSALVERNVFDEGLTFETADRDFQWAAGVTAFGMLLRHSPHRSQASYALVEELVGAAVGEDPKGRRAEFLGLVAKAQGKPVPARAMGGK